MDEYIERELLLMGLDSHIDTMRGKFGHVALLNSAISLIQNTRDFIAAFPAADVAPMVHGRWEVAANPYCSQCFAECRDETPYCPNCGARMRKDGEGK